MRKRWRLLLVILVLHVSCTAPSDVAHGNSSLIVSADPPQIGLNGTSVLTVVGADGDGNPLPDSTVVSFTVDEAGSISPSSVHLQNGRGTATYHASFVDGDMTITASSGSVEATTTVTVSDEINQNVFLSANPATLPNGGGTSVITAAVTDGSGQPLQGIDLTFSTDAGTLQSGGAVVATDSTGVAQDVLNTSSNATVTATTADGFSGSTTVMVNVANIVCHLTVDNSTLRVGQTVNFLDTSDDPNHQIARYHWDFGDDTSADGKNVQHAYNNVGSFSVVHSVTDMQGNSLSCDPVTIQVSQ
jgi:PKD domain